MLSIIDPEDIRTKLQIAFWTDADSASLNAWSNRIQSYSFNEQYEQLQRQQTQVILLQLKIISLSTEAVLNELLPLPLKDSQELSHQRQVYVVITTYFN